MSALYSFAVLETYRDGSTWKHYFHSRAAADAACESMAASNPHRTYTVVPQEDK